jgi:hypothetical protein
VHVTRLSFFIRFFCLLGEMGELRIECGVGCVRTGEAYVHLMIGAASRYIFNMRGDA